jgi:CubicO group peptidase (beta-lactamase class C family)
MGAFYLGVEHMGHFNRRRLIAGAAASGLLFTRAVHADTPALPAELDTYFAAVLRDWDLPGGALAIVKDGEIVAAKGYGVRERGRLARWDWNRPMGPRFVPN